MGIILDLLLTRIFKKMVTRRKELSQYYCNNLWQFVEIRNTDATQMFTGKKFTITLNNAQKVAFVSIFCDIKRNSQIKQALETFIDSIETSNERWTNVTNRWEYKRIFFTPNGCETELDHSEIVALRRKMFRI